MNYKNKKNTEKHIDYCFDNKIANGNNIFFDTPSDINKPNSLAMDHWSNLSHWTSSETKNSQHLDSITNPISVGWDCGNDTITSVSNVSSSYVDSALEVVDQKLAKLEEIELICYKMLNIISNNQVKYRLEIKDDDLTGHENLKLTSSEKVKELNPFDDWDRAMKLVRE